MGLRGPKPKSAKLESAQGFPGRRKSKTKAQDVVPPQGDENPQDSVFVPPPPPKYLRRKGERDIWRELTEDPARQLWFKRSDHGTLARYCDIENRRRKMAAKSMPESYTITDGNGNRVIKVNPNVSIYARYCQLLSAIEAQIGGTPLSRLNVAHKMGNLGTAPSDGKRSPNAHATPPAGAPSPPAAPGTPASPLGVLKSAAPAPGTKPN